MFIIPTEYLSHSIGHLPGRSVLFIVPAADADALRNAPMQSQLVYDLAAGLLQGGPRGPQSGHRLLSMQVSGWPVQAPSALLNEAPKTQQLLPFYRCRKTSSGIGSSSSQQNGNRHDMCMIAQEKLHPVCAQRPPDNSNPASSNGIYYHPPPACHVVAESCKEDRECRWVQRIQGVQGS